MPAPGADVAMGLGRFLNREPEIALYQQNNYVVVLLADLPHELRGPGGFRNGTEWIVRHFLFRNNRGLSRAYAAVAFPA